MKTILFNGAYTIHSAGDDAPLEVILALLKEQLGTDTIKANVLCRHPNIKFDKAFGVSTLQNLEYTSKEASLDRWLRGFNFGDSQEILFEMIRHYKEADLVILGAGNFINNNSFGLFRGMLPRLCISAFLAKMTHTPCMLYGLSASELSSPLAISMTQWLLQNVSKVTFRESKSVKLLQSLNIKIPKETEVLPDPVLASSCVLGPIIHEIFEKEGIPVKSTKPRLSMSLRNFHLRGEDMHHKFIQNISKVIDAWTSNGGEVLFVAQCMYEQGQPHDDDRNLAISLRESLKDSSQVYVLKSQYLPCEVEGFYSGSDVALCTRLHGGVFACKQDVPTIALAYEPKIYGFWEQIGMNKYCIPFDSSAETILERIEDALENFPRRHINDRLVLLKAQVHRYGEIAAELLKSN